MLDTSITKAKCTCHTLMQQIDIVKLENRDVDACSAGAYRAREKGTQ